MPWNRSEPDPLEVRRRELAEKERLVSERMSQLTEQLRQAGEPVPTQVKPADPPVWRMEDEGSSPHPTDPAPARKRNLARQRQRDMIVFFVCISVLLLVLIVVLWVAYVRNTALNNGA